MTAMGKKGAPKKFVSETMQFSYRTDKKKWQLYSAIATLRGETPTTLIDKHVEEYIEKHRNVLNEAAKET